MTTTYRKVFKEVTLAPDNQLILDDIAHINYLSIRARSPVMLSEREKRIENMAITFIELHGMDSTGFIVENLTQSNIYITAEIGGTD